MNHVYLFLMDLFFICLGFFTQCYASTVYVVVTCLLEMAAWIELFFLHASFLQLILH